MPRIHLQTKISYKKFKDLFEHLFHYSHDETREAKMKASYENALKQLEERQKADKVLANDEQIEEKPGEIAETPSN